MSVHFISGKPGAGKSLYATKLIFEELRYGTRHVVTNVPLLVGELNAYYHEHYADDSGWRKYAIPWWIPRWLGAWLFWCLPEFLALRFFPISPCDAEQRLLQPQADDICSRVHLITDEEMSVFFTKRPGSTIEHIDNERWRAGVRPDYSVVKDGGVLFALDEVHIAFNSRAWATTGAEVLYYLSQHRKLGDDVLAITQAVGNVDKQFRSVAQDFTYLRNFAKETFGHFRLPSRFVRKTYSQPPVGTGEKTEPMEIGTFTLDVKGLARCYDTARGVGIHGRAGADKKERKKGIHWLWFVVGAPAILWAAFHFTPRLIVGLWHHSVPSSVPPSPVKSPATTVNMTHFQPGPSVADETKTNEASAARAPVHTNAVTCVGYIVLPAYVQVFLSDGRDARSDWGEVQEVTRRKVKCFDQEFPIVPAIAWNDWSGDGPQTQPTPVITGYMPPVNSVQVTVIGQAHDSRTFRGNGFASMPQNAGGFTAPRRHRLPETKPSSG